MGLRVLSSGCGRPRGNFDVFLTSVGFESRCREVARWAPSEISRRVAVPFQDRQLLSFEKNRTYFRRSGFEILESSEADFGATALRLVQEVSAANERPRLLVDIS